MFTFTVAIKRSYLRAVYSTLGGVTLLAALSAEPGKGAPTPSEMVEMWESLIGDYELAVYYLGQDGIASPTDTQIYNKMMAVVLVAATSYGGDFSNFRREASYRVGMS